MAHATRTTGSHVVDRAARAAAGAMRELTRLVDEAGAPGNPAALLAEVDIVLQRARQVMLVVNDETRVRPDGQPSPELAEVLGEDLFYAAGYVGDAIVTLQKVVRRLRPARVGDRR